jgi:hypothetical protein
MKKERKWKYDGGSWNEAKIWTIEERILIKRDRPRKCFSYASVKKVLNIGWRVVSHFSGLPLQEII